MFAVLCMKEPQPHEQLLRQLTAALGLSASVNVGVLSDHKQTALCPPTVPDVAAGRGAGAEQEGLSAQVSGTLWSTGPDHGKRRLGGAGAPESSP